MHTCLDLYITMLFSYLVTRLAASVLLLHQDRKEKWKKVEEVYASCQEHPEAAAILPRPIPSSICMWWSKQILCPKCDKSDISAPRMGCIRVMNTQCQHLAMPSAGLCLRANVMLCTCHVRLCYSAVKLFDRHWQSPSWVWQWEGLERLCQIHLPVILPCQYSQQNLQGLRHLASWCSHCNDQS